MYMYIHIYIYLYVYIHTHIYTHSDTYTCTYTYILIHRHTHTYTHTHIYIYNRLSSADRSTFIFEATKASTTSTWMTGPIQTRLSSSWPFPSAPWRRKIEGKNKAENDRNR